ncbi:hypothetical protein VM1G_11879 [Cytospora mali]|uniref:Uncharacterized protein n=1 Tax=Cytospora mali TaxID=578113 RepID=A0A194WAW2_CYTMA|nr:hypothetical protein VM1G_11879 [Valsa mali]
MTYIDVTHDVKDHPQLNHERDGRESPKSKVGLTWTLDMITDQHVGEGGSVRDAGSSRDPVTIQPTSQPPSEAT